MSDTAMVRRVQDYKNSGLNPVLAAGGPGASTPSISPAQVQPTYKGGAGNTAAQSIMLMQQMKQMEAQTNLTTQQARLTKVDADNKEKWGPKEAEWAANTKFESSEQADIETKKKQIESDLSAQQLEKFRVMWPKLVELAEQQVQTGKIDLEALKSVAGFGGNQAHITGLVQFFRDVILQTIRNKD